MKPEEFVQAIKLCVGDSAVQDQLALLENPPGRKPRKELVELSRWYKKCSADDKEKIQQLLQAVSQATIFGFFCVLDGVRVVEDEPDKGEFELYFVKQGKKTLLNNFKAEPLHDIFQSIKDEK